jgi:O-antigen ligase
MADRLHAPARRLAAMVIALTLALAILEPVHAPTPVRIGIAVALAGAGVLLGYVAPPAAVALLAGPALLGPAARLGVAGVSLNAGDAYLAAITVGILSGRRFRLPPATPTRWLAGLAVPIVTASWLASRAPRPLLPSMVGLAELAAAYLLTLAAVRSERTAWRVLEGWLFAVTVSSTLVLIAYARGVPLLLGVDAAAADRYGSLLQSEDTLYRATFFVTGFIFPLAASLVGVLAALIGRRWRVTELLVLLGATAINLVAAVLMASLTVWFGVALAAAAVVPLGAAVRRRPLAAMGSALVVALAGVGTVALAALSLPASQVALLAGRIGQSESLHLRLAVWQNVGRYLLDSPKTLLLGLGPDYTTRVVSDPLVQRLLSGASVQQQAVDSGYLYAIVNFGLPAVLLVATGVGIVLWRLAGRLRRSRPEAVPALILIGAIAVWLVMALTQQHGVSKPVLAFVQAVALAEILTRRLTPSLRRPVA